MQRILYFTELMFQKCYLKLFIFLPTVTFTAKIHSVVVIVVVIVMVFVAAAAAVVVVVVVVVLVVEVVVVVVVVVNCFICMTARFYCIAKAYL